MTRAPSVRPDETAVGSLAGSGRHGRGPGGGRRLLPAYPARPGTGVAGGDGGAAVVAGAGRGRPVRVDGDVRAAAAATAGRVRWFDVAAPVDPVDLRPHRHLDRAPGRG